MNRGIARHLTSSLPSSGAITGKTYLLRKEPVPSKQKLIREALDELLPFFAKQEYSHLNCFGNIHALERCSPLAKTSSMMATSLNFSIIHRYQRNFQGDR